LEVAGKPDDANTCERKTKRRVNPASSQSAFTRFAQPMKTDSQPNFSHAIIFQETRALYGRDDVGLFEVVPFEKERFASKFGQGIGEAVTEIQPCRVAALAEVVEGLAREMRLLDSHGFDHNANAAKQCVALLGDLNAELTLDDNREFDEIPGGNTAARSAADGLDIEFGIRLFRQDGDER